MAYQQTYPTAVVTEMGVGGLSIIRSLGKKGIPIIGVDSKKDNIGSFSRYCRPILCKDASDESLIETLTYIGKKLSQQGVILCASDASALAISKYREELVPYYNFVLPRHEVIETLMNKRLFHEFALKNGLSVPKTIFTNSAEELRIASDQVGFPCVIKPELRDSYWYRHVPAEEKVIFCASEKQYFDTIERYRIEDRKLIVQQWIHGNDDDIFFCLAYINRLMEPLATFAGKTIRLYPAFTGLYTLAESYEDPVVTHETLYLLQLAGCNGLCSVEFKYCHKDKSFKITEPTVGRVDMQESMATACGIDIPYIAYLDAIGMRPKRAYSFKEGVKWMCETVEIYGLRNYLKENGFRKLISSYTGKKAYGLIDLSDLSPFIAFSVPLMKRKLSKIIGFKPNKVD